MVFPSDHLLDGHFIFFMAVLKMRIPPNMDSGRFSGYLPSSRNELMYDNKNSAPLCPQFMGQVCTLWHTFDDKQETLCESHSINLDALQFYKVLEMGGEESATGCARICMHVP